MVYFACNNCGESLKKAQVEMHLTRSNCRGCSVSCMDCHKDFDPKSYVHHTKCITEDQKYSGGNFKMKQSTLNNMDKREKWLLVIKGAAENNDCSPPAKELLKNLTFLESCPLKKAPFDSFISNGMRRYMSYSDEAWNALKKYEEFVNKTAEENEKKDNVEEEKKTKANTEIKTKKKKKKSVDADYVTTDLNSENNVEKESEVSATNNELKTKKKKKKSVNAENATTDLNSETNAEKESDVSATNNELKTKKKKKKKSGEISSELLNDEEIEKYADLEDKFEQEKQKKSKNKKKKAQTDETEEDGELLELAFGKGKENDDTVVEKEKMEVEVKEKKKNKKRKAETSENYLSDIKMSKLNDTLPLEEEVQTVSGKKFPWKSIIIDILTVAKNNKLPLKKLQRKVMNAYNEQGGDPRDKNKSKEYIENKFTKILNKMENLSIAEGKIKLLN